METFGTALLADEIPAARAVTAVVSRGEIAAALQDPDSPPELYLDIDRQGEERSTISITWSHDELEQLLGRASGDDILLTFDRDELQSVFDDVEAHGLRQKALIFTVAVAGALGSGATIANAAPSIEHGSGASLPRRQYKRWPPIHRRIGLERAHPRPADRRRGTTASTASVHASTGAQAVDTGLASNVHTPACRPATREQRPRPRRCGVHRRAAAVDAGLVSNVHTPACRPATREQRPRPRRCTRPQAPKLSTPDWPRTCTPGLQTGDEGSTAGTTSVKVSAGSSSSEFLGVPSRDVTDGLIAGGVLLAIAGAGFAGSRRMGTPRPA